MPAVLRCPKGRIYIGKKIMIHSIGLTGGIGSGKSTIAGILKQLGYPVYLADPEASRLINRSVEIRNDLTGLFGAGSRVE